MALRAMPGNPRVYLSGPMTGYPSLNFPAFEEGARRLREAGFSVVSPHEKDLQQGFDPEDPEAVANFDLRAALEWDVEAVLGSDGVVVLDGWEDSSGAMIEVLAATGMGLPVLTLEEALEPLRQTYPYAV